MPHCHMHGEYSSDIFFPGCPKCREEEKQADKDREDTERYREETAQAAEEREEARAEAEREREAREREREESREEAARERAERAAEQAAEHTYRVNNPGEYECPYCMLTSLKRGARRCPKCQHDIEATYWSEVSAREEEARKRQEEARLRAEEARKQKEKAHEDWLKSPEGIAAIAAENATRIAAQNAAVAAAAAESRSNRGRRLGNTAMWLSLSGILCCLPAPIGFVMGLVALNDFRCGNNTQGIGKAITAVAVGALPTLYLVFMGLAAVVQAISHGR